MFNLQLFYHLLYYLLTINLYGDANPDVCSIQLINLDLI